jgi:hypothetical protein
MSPDGFKDGGVIGVHEVAEGLRGHLFRYGGVLFGVGKQADAIEQATTLIEMGDISGDGVY